MSKKAHHRLFEQRHTHPTSISGLLCRSTICDAKFSMQSAECNVAFMQSR